MTSNQIALRQAIETERANKAREAENYRSNLAKETETNRSNLATEAELHRKNLASEDLTRETNASKIRSPWGLASLFGERMIYGTDKNTGTQSAAGKDGNVVYPNDVYNYAVEDSGIKNLWDSFTSHFSGKKKKKDEGILIKDPNNKRKKDLYHGKNSKWA